MNKHKFSAAVWNQLICGICLKRSENHHCESCDNKDDEVYFVNKKMLLCGVCFTRHHEADKRAEEAIKKDTEHKLSLEQIINQVNRIVETDAIKTLDGATVRSIIDEAVQGNIKQFTEFFNANIPSIIALKQQCDENPELKDADEKRYALAAMLRGRVQVLSRVLFQFNAKELEVGAEIRSIHKYLNQMIPQLRAELRAEYQKQEANYQPPQKEVKAPAKRQTTEDKLVEKYALMMKIPVERARFLLKNKLKEEAITCTCAETPGVCKLHAS